MKIASYPATTLRAARGMRDTNLGLVEQGKDPASVRDERRKLALIEAAAPGTFGEIAEMWWLSEQVNADPALTPGTLARNRAIIDNVLVHVASLTFGEVKTRDVALMADKIKNAIGLEYARRCLGFTSQIFLLVRSEASAHPAHLRREPTRNAKAQIATTDSATIATSTEPLPLSGE
jgi:hypothetical protein